MLRAKYSTSAIVSTEDAVNPREDVALMRGAFRKYRQYRLS